MKQIDMKRLLVLTTALVMTLTTVAQDDKAKSVLDKVKAKTKDYTTVTATFTKTYKKGSINEKSSGDLKIKDNKYYINTGEGQKIYSDGRTVWTWLEGDGEVYKCPKDDSDDAFDPAKMFSIWEEDFKYRYKGEETISGRKYDVILLNPMNPGEKNFHTIELKIDQETSEVKYFIITGKDQSKTTYRLDSITPNQEISDSRFRFLKSMCPDCDVIDC